MSVFDVFGFQIVIQQFEESKFSHISPFKVQGIKFLLEDLDLKLAHKFSPIRLHNFGRPAAPVQHDDFNPYSFLGRKSATEVATCFSTLLPSLCRLLEAINGFIQTNVHFFCFFSFFFFFFFFFLLKLNFNFPLF